MKTNLSNHLKNITFFNNSSKNMNFDEVYNNILSFIKKDPMGVYTLAIGTDSQAKSDYTTFVSAIMIYRLGKGAWGCMSKFSYPRNITNLKEKISIETTLTQQIAFMFKPSMLDELINIILPNIDKGAEFHHEVHIDIGRNGKTKRLINEMTSYFSYMGFEAKIKPYSFAASSYADRFTK